MSVTANIYISRMKIALDNMILFARADVGSLGNILYVHWLKAYDRAQASAISEGSK